MFVKLVRNPKGQEPRSHIYEADHIQWGFQKVWPNEYRLPFSIGDQERNAELIMVVRLYRNLKQVEVLVPFECAIYVMSDSGKTIDSFVV